MQLVELLEAEHATTESYFRKALIGEDLVRLRQAETLARNAATAGALVETALMIGWTPGDLRTRELRPALEPMLAALWCVIHSPDHTSEQTLIAAWRTFEQLRLDRLAGCLARVPRPQ